MTTIVKARKIKSFPDDQQAMLKAFAGHFNYVVTYHSPSNGMTCHSRHVQWDQARCSALGFRHYSSPMVIDMRPGS